jgi:hypothetical protein
MSHYCRRSILLFRRKVNPQRLSATVRAGLHSQTLGSMAITFENCLSTSFRLFASSSKSKDPATTLGVNDSTEGEPATPTTSPAAMKFYKDGKLVQEKCGSDTEASDQTQEDEMENMFVQGPMGIEWNGPTRGGKRPEPTRFGDWERKGRASDF